MKTIYVVTLTTVLLSRSLAEDPKRADVDPHQTETLRQRTLRVAPPTSLPLVKTSPANPRNRGLTSIGGPAAKSKNTAAISGTGISR